MEVDTFPMDVTPTDALAAGTFRYSETDTDPRPVLQELQRNIFEESPEPSLTFKPAPTVVAAPPTASMALLDSPELFPMSSRARGFGSQRDMQGTVPSRSSSSRSLSAASDWERFCESRVGDVLLWRNPALTGLSFLGGSLSVLAVHFVLHGDHHYTWLTVASYACTLLAAANFLHSLVSSRSRSLADSRVAASAASRAADAVMALARAHDRLLASRDPFLTLKVICLLWFLSAVGRVVSPWTLVTVSFFASYTLPVVYYKYCNHVRTVAGHAAEVLKGRWNALGLSRKQQATVLGVSTLVVWLHCSWATRMMSLFVGLVTVRCNLRPAEVEAIISNAEPYTQSVKKRARRLSVAATDFARRSLTVSKPPQQPPSRVPSSKAPPSKAHRR